MACLVLASIHPPTSMPDARLWGGEGKGKEKGKGSVRAGPQSIDGRWAARVRGAKQRADNSLSRISSKWWLITYITLFDVARARADRGYY